MPGAQAGGPGQRAFQDVVELDNGQAGRASDHGGQRIGPVCEFAVSNLIKAWLVTRRHVAWTGGAGVGHTGFAGPVIPVIESPIVTVDIVAPGLASLGNTVDVVM